MTAEKLSALFAILVPAVVQLIIDNRGLTNIEAATLLYNVLGKPSRRIGGVALTVC